MKAVGGKPLLDELSIATTAVDHCRSWHHTLMQMQGAFSLAVGHLCFGSVPLCRGRVGQGFKGVQGSDIVYTGRKHQLGHTCNVLLSLKKRDNFS